MYFGGSAWKGRYILEVEGGRYTFGGLLVRVSK